MSWSSTPNNNFQTLIVGFKIGFQEILGQEHAFRISKKDQIVPVTLLFALILQCLLFSFFEILSMFFSKQKYSTASCWVSVVKINKMVILNSTDY